MDAIPSNFLIENRLAEQQAAQQGGAGELDRDAFLQLLLSQLSNQDPLSPMQDHEFVAQLATFSSLEQLENLNAGMQASLLMNQSLSNSLATNLIGKEILSEGSAVHLGTDGSTSFRVDLGSEASLTVLIRDAEGNLVRRIEVGESEAGANSVEWDGRNESGDRVDAGDYTVEVLAADADGNPVTSSVRVRALVTGVRFENGAGFLMLGDQSVPLSSVVEVFASSGS